LKGTLHKVLSTGSTPQLPQHRQEQIDFGGNFCSRRFTLWPWNR